MNSVTNPIERIRPWSGAFIDLNFKQSREGFGKQLARRLKLATVSDEEIDRDIWGFQSDIAELVVKVQPYQLPEDYIFYLEYYGGLVIWVDAEYRFEVQGIGPMVNEEYGDFVCDNWGERADPLLPGPRGFIIAYLRLDLELAKAKALGVQTKTITNPSDEEVEYVPAKWIEFRMDLAGLVKKHGIIGLGPDETDTPHPLSLGDGDNRSWRKLADSFSEWLELAAHTRGLFGYSYLEGESK